MPLIPRSLSAIFCDDIRQESSGKLIYIGVYHSALIVQEFPATLPTFHIMATVVTPTINPFRKLVVRALQDLETIKEMEIPGNELASVPESPFIANIDPKERILSARVLLSWSPLRLDGPCILRVVAQTESEELACLALPLLTKLPESPDPEPNV
ncbi:MAG: hypothetical protein IPL51_09955 [Candidatus Competibacteraceae bacterium]|nr:hypothetical protein [Candidatus Competibacteraceae bacterium]